MFPLSLDLLRRCTVSEDTNVLSETCDIFGRLYDAMHGNVRVFALRGNSDREERLIGKWMSALLDEHQQCTSPGQWLCIVRSLERDASLSLSLAQHRKYLMQKLYCVFTHSEFSRPPIEQAWQIVLDILRLEIISIEKELASKST